jgi:ABC-2 type transport system permease protein
MTSDAPAPRSPLRDALHAEWTKLRTTASTAWMLLATAGLTVALSALAAATTEHRAGVGRDIVKVSLTGVQVGQALVAVLAVLAICGEYSTGMIATTLTAIPRRRTVLAAKAVLVAAAVLVASALGVVGSLVAGRLILPGNGFTAGHGYPPLSLADGSTLRAVVGSVVYLALIALLSLGLATAVRDAALATGTVLGVLYMFPILTAVLADPDWTRRLQRIAPTNAGLAIQATDDLQALPIAPWTGLGVLAAWAGGALLVGSLVLHRRDA